LKVKGPKGKLTVPIPAASAFKQNDGTLEFSAIPTNMPRCTG
jgi:ribosomal protein L6P/L9E